MHEIHRLKCVHICGGFKEPHEADYCKGVDLKGGRGALNVLPVTEGVTEKGLDVMMRYGIQFYDSLLLVSAAESGCSEFISEDLNDGQIYCGMKVVNPFKGVS